MSQLEPLKQADIGPPAEAHSASRPQQGFTRWDLWVGVIPVVGILPMLFFELQNLWSRTHMQFFPLCILAAAYFAYFGCKGPETTHPLRRWCALGIFVATIVLYAYAVWKFSPWLAHFAAIMLFLAWALGRCGNARWPSVVAWTGLLLTTLTLPLNLDIEFIQWLQLRSSWACSKALDALSIANLRQANVIQIKGRELFVEEACSGIGSLYALLAVAVLLLIQNRRSFLVSILSLATVPVWAIMGNFIRLFAIAVGQEYFGRDLSHGTDHEILGLATFAIAGVCFWLTDYFLAAMLYPVPAGEPEFAPVFQAYNQALIWPQTDPLGETIPEDAIERREYLEAKAQMEARRWQWQPLIWNQKKWLVTSVVTCSLALVACGIAPAILIARSGLPTFEIGLPSIDAGELGDFPKEDSLPEAVGTWRRVGFFHEQRTNAALLGQHSLVWKYLWRDQVVAVSLDFPFDTWHPLSVCYTLTGWKVLDQSVTSAESESVWPWEELVMTNNLGGYGYVNFCAFNEDLEPFTDFAGSPLDSRLNATSSGIVAALRSEKQIIDKTTYQIQVFCDSGIELTSEQREELRSQFKEFRKLLIELAGPAIKAL